MTVPESKTLATVAGRKVKISRGNLSQTVNICTDANQVGVYESTYVLRPDIQLTTVEISAFVDLDALQDWLLAQDGELRQPGTGQRSPRIPDLLPPSVEDDWVAQARVAVDRAIEQVVKAFSEEPYLHRVEHSLHVVLHAALKAQPHLDGTYAIGTTKRRTQLIHKEWPETRPGEEGAPHGKFDIGIIAPSQLKAATLDQFRAGRINAALAIEVGLDYGYRHLKQDHDKLLNSEVPAPYLLHLSRLRVTDQVVTEDLLVNARAPLCTGYAHIDPKTGKIRIKRPSDNAVSDY